MSAGRANALTVDVEEWFHVCGMGGKLAPAQWDRLPSRVERTTDLVLELLDRRQVRGTFFVLGWVAERHPRLVERILAAGHEVASHGHSHTRVYELDRASFAAELDRGLAALRAAGADAVRGFRAPEWSVNDRSLWALQVLVEKGFRYDSSMTPLRLIGSPSYPQRPHLRDTPAGSIAEFPPLVARRLGQNVPLGGGWGLRLSSPRRVLGAIEECNSEGRPAALFVHPWELDPDPPRVRLPLGHRFAHYAGLPGFAQRLDAILAGAAFGRMDDVLASLGGLGRAA